MFRLTVGQYHEMIRAGVLGEEDPVELIEGLLVYHTPKKPKHRLGNQSTRGDAVPLIVEGKACGLIAVASILP
jgi:hypothetical protein